MKTSVRTKATVSQILLRMLVNICRIVLALTFLFSGFVKANDPLGMVYKLEDYFTAWGLSGIGESLVLFMALCLAFLEFFLGSFLLFGTHRKLTSRVTFLFMAVMTLFTVYIYIYDPVSDCGCFGDAVILTNGETLAKNILLLACAVVVAKWRVLMWRPFKRRWNWLVTCITFIVIIVYSCISLYCLPPIDFRPFKVGTDLNSLLAVPQDERPQFEVTLVYEKDGRQMEISIDDDEPDSTWTYVETRRKQVKAAGRNLVADFYILDEDEEDITRDLLATDAYMFFLISPDLEHADESSIDIINDLYDYSQQSDMEFICLTASNPEQQMHWADYTGAEYLFYQADERMLKTMVRANPGLMLVKDGIIIHKWGNWNFPDVEEVERLIEKLD